MPNSDADLVQAHQEKIDADLLLLDGKLEVIRAAQITVQREVDDFACRRKAHDLEHHSLSLRPIENAAAIIEANHIEHGLWAHWKSALMAQKTLESQREELLRRRRVISEEITLAQFSASPIRRIPADILRAIFAALKSAMELDHRNKRPKFTAGRFPEFPAVGRGAASLISSVCSEWRALAGRTPLLWTDFSFTLSASRTTTDLAALYMERSAPATLRIELIGWEDLEQSASAMGVIAPHSERLSSLRVLSAVSPYPTYRPPGEIFSSLPLLGNLPHLSFLQVPDCTSLAQILPRLPALHTLDISEYCDPPSVPRAGAGRNSLVGVTIVAQMSGGAMMPWAPAALLNFPLLTHWTVMLEAPVIGTTVRPGMHWDAPPSLFHAFRAPALQSLDISFLNHPADVPHLLLRSHCNITRLALTDCEIRVFDLVHILPYTPDLETLAVVRGHSTIVTDRLFQHLAIEPHPVTI